MLQQEQNHERFTREDLAAVSSHFDVPLLFVSCGHAAVRVTQDSLEESQWRIRRYLQTFAPPGIFLTVNLGSRMFKIFLPSDLPSKLSAAMAPYSGEIK
jgi:hypothetical protein